MRIDPANNPLNGGHSLPHRALASSGPFPCSPLQMLESFFRLSNMLRNRLAPMLAELGLNDARLAVLTCVDSGSEPGVTQSEIAETLYQSESNVSGIVDRMRRDRLLSRRRSTVDRRRCEVKLLPTGRSLLAEVREHQHDWFREVLLGIPGREREEFLQTLRQMTQFMTPPADSPTDHDSKSRSSSTIRENQNAT